MQLSLILVVIVNVLRSFVHGVPHTLAKVKILVSVLPVLVGEDGGTAALEARLLGLVADDEAVEP